MSGVPAQLALRFPPRRHCTLEGFETGANSELLERLRDVSMTGFSVVWIAAATGTGKSHLLQAACVEVTRAGGTAAYLPSDCARDGARVLDGFEHLDRIAIDDLPSWLGTREREASLLALYHGLASRRASLVVAARETPAHVGFLLADLASRFRAAQTYAIANLDDAALRRFALARAHERGFEIGADAVNFLLHAGPRIPGALVDLMDRLDRASLVARRRVTVPLIRDVLREQ